LLIIRANNNIIANEELIDDVFGKGPRSYVARMLLYEEVTPQRMQEIRDSVKKKFPGEFETRRKSSLDKMIHDVKSRLDQMMWETTNA
jgi:flagellar motor switch protein FliG